MTKSDRFWWTAARVFGAVVAGTILIYSYFYFVTPKPISKPRHEHSHFRMQIIVDGQPVDFSVEEFQHGYSKDNCDANITEQPIHFHDNKDQFVHIHWQDITGGLVLKNYGWNLTGGMPASLGYRFDNFPFITRIPIHGHNLPGKPKTLYVYTGDEASYQLRKTEDFLNQDLETFFGKQSNIGNNEEALLPGFADWLFPKAHAHGEVIDEHGNPNETEEELSRINNLIGNVVIFAQEKEPTPEQIRARFADLEPLSDSTCGG